MVVQVVSEKLNVTDCGGSSVGIGEVTREENKSDVAHVLRIDKAGDMTDLQWWIARSVQNLRCTLYCG